MVSQEDTNFAARLEGHARMRGGEVAFRFLHHGDGDSDLTWVELWQEADRQASRILEAGMAGKQVGILCPDPRDFITTLAATIVAGAIAVPIPATLSRRSAPRIRATIEASHLSMLVAPDTLLTAEWVASIKWPADLHRVPLKTLRLGAPQAIGILPRLDPTRPMLQQFTSGSTGTARGVLLNHANVAANCEAIAEAYTLSAESIALSWLPLHHDMGLVGHVLTPMWVGFRSCIMNPLRFLQRPLRWLDAIGQERATITSAPNFAYELCIRAAAEEIPNLDLRTLETAVCGGEPVMPETVERFCQIFASFGFDRRTFAPSYGLAEATLLVASGKTPTGPRSALLPRPIVSDGPLPSHVCVGKPVKGLEVRIVDPGTHEPLADEQIGEIEITGTSVGRVVGKRRRRWMPTGDLGYLSQRELFVVGRSKELLILRGQNVFPAEIEAAALPISARFVPGGVAAVGIDRDGTQHLVLIVEARIGASEEIHGTLLKAVREGVTLATGHTATDIVFVKPGSLPRTTSGKLRRSDIAGLYVSGDLSARPFSLPGRREVGLEHA